MSQVFCSVSNCHYYGQGNVCQANQIMVTSGTMAQNLSPHIDVPYAAQISQTPVDKSPETCCKTFVHKNDFFQNTDGALKK
ncbi:MAG: DUF1540 domain-containing protein [Desulfotomaculaceae bacterium]|nr:DUF1540 domain-containing protein [Desulfotomaculaceae bacterium]